MPRQRHLDGVLAKIIRADEHFKALKREISDYLSACARTLTLPVKSIHARTKSVSGLNQFMSRVSGSASFWATACTTLALRSIASGGVSAVKATLFCDRDGDKNWRSQRAKRLKGIGVDAHAIIDELQPCCAGKHAPAHPLAKNPVVEPLIPVTT